MKSVCIDLAQHQNFRVLMLHDHYALACGFFNTDTDKQDRPTPFLCIFIYPGETEARHSNDKRMEKCVVSDEQIADCE